MLTNVRVFCWISLYLKRQKRSVNYKLECKTTETLNFKWILTKRRAEHVQKRQTRPDRMNDECSYIPNASEYHDRGGKSRTFLSSKALEAPETLHVMFLSYFPADSQMQLSGKHWMTLSNLHNHRPHVYRTWDLQRASVGTASLSTDFFIQSVNICQHNRTAPAVN